MINTKNAFLRTFAYLLTGIGIAIILSALVTPPKFLNIDINRSTSHEVL